jgi:hypothetical protein
MQFDEDEVKATRRIIGALRRMQRPEIIEKIHIYTIYAKILLLKKLERKLVINKEEVMEVIQRLLISMFFFHLEDTL